MPVESVNEDGSPWSLPESPHFKIEDVAGLGRAVIAQSNIACNAHVLSTSNGESPLAHVILRPYRKEVCAWCFNYDRGREWKIRDPTTSISFCSLECQHSWKEQHDDLSIQALTIVEGHLKEQLKRQDDTNSSRIEVGHTAEEQAVLEEKVATAWRDAEDVAVELRQARTNHKPTKFQKSIIRNVLQRRLDADIVTYVISGILAAYRNSRRFAKLEQSDTNPQTYLPSLFELVPDEQVFNDNPMTSSPLHDYTTAYLIMLALVPADLLDLASSQLITNLASRAAHNAFSIRPAGNSDGEQSGEFLGWGVWPEASFFNHSCRPNIRKERVGRSWIFSVDCHNGVKEGEQLCITYLGGDEKDLDVHERRQRLEEQWGFVCGCERCLEEAGDSELI